MIQSFKDMAQRAVNAEKDFAETMMRCGGVDQATAEKLTAFYLKKKLAKLDYGIGRIGVKHGGLLDRVVIGRAVTVMNGGTIDG